MQEQMEKVLIYGAGGVALLFYAVAAWKAGRVGFGNRFLSFGRTGHVEKDAKPRVFRLFLAGYVAAGVALLGVAAYHALQ